MISSLSSSVALAFACASGVLSATCVANSSSLTLSTVTGYFLQDLNSTDPSTFDYTATNFGLINRTYPSDSGYKSSSSVTQWQRFARQVSSLNNDATAGTTYKLLFLGRHGEGYHNAAETYYGTPAWNCYWAEIDGNATAVWSDAHLTNNGIAQAQKANNFWRSEIETQKIPTPQKFYTSPLYRCLSTANVTFAGLDDYLVQNGGSPFVPTAKELLREGISIHTCDRRSNRTFIHQSFSSYVIEPGFAEDDQLWNGVTAETSSAQDIRSQKVLHEIFGETAAATYVSITSHSGEIASILRVLGHRTFSLSTGAIIPVLVKAVTQQTSSPTTTAPPWTASPHCTSPPVTSIAGGACVCQNSAAPVTTTLAGSGPNA